MSTVETWIKTYHPSAFRASGSKPTLEPRTTQNRSPLKLGTVCITSEITPRLYHRGTGSTIQNPASPQLSTCCKTPNNLVQHVSPHHHRLYIYRRGRYQPHGNKLSPQCAAVTAQCGFSSPNKMFGCRVIPSIVARSAINSSIGQSHRQSNPSPSFTNETKPPSFPNKP